MKTGPTGMKTEKGIALGAASEGLMGGRAGRRARRAGPAWSGKSR